MNPATPIPAARARQSVIVVDDDEALLSALQFGLRLEGFEVESHRSSDTVVAGDLPRDRCCLVIDYLLPNEDGLSLLERLRGEQVHLPAIVITSHPRAAMRAKAAALGAVIVEKPLLGDGLTHAIRSALEDGLSRNP